MGRQNGWVVTGRAPENRNLVERVTIVLPTRKEAEEEVSRRKSITRTIGSRNVHVNLRVRRVKSGRIVD